MEWLWLIPILFFLILTHEFGHFLTARLFNVTVHEFGIGFPPKALVIARRNGVEYTLNWLPIGGFVRMEGEEGPSADPNSFGNKPAWQRLIILASGSVVNLLTAVLIFIGLSLGGADVPQYQTGVWSLEPGGAAQQAGIQPGDIILRANDKDIKTADDFRLVVTLNANTNVVLTIDRGGQQKVITVVPRTVDPGTGKGATGIGLVYVYSNLALGPLDPNGGAVKAGLQQGDVITAIDDKPVKNSFEIAQALNGKGSAKVTVNRNGQIISSSVRTFDPLGFAVIPDGSAAKQAGLKANDVLIGVNGSDVNNHYEVNQAIAGKQTVNITVTRGSGIVALANVPVAALTDNYGTATSPTSLDGVAAYPFVHVDYSLTDAIGAGFAKTGDNVALVFNSLKAVVQGSQPIKNFAGVVGIAKITGDAARGGGLIGLLTLMGLLGANLFFVNMLPFPALDGGRFLFVLIEILAFGRRVPARIEMALNLAGMALLLIFIAYVSYFDIIRTWFS